MRGSGKEDFDRYPTPIYAQISKTNQVGKERKDTSVEVFTAMYEA